MVSISVVMSLPTAPTLSFCSVFDGRVAEGVQAQADVSSGYGISRSGVKEEKSWAARAQAIVTRERTSRKGGGWWHLSCIKCELPGQFATRQQAYFDNNYTEIFVHNVPTFGGVTEPGVPAL